MPPLRFLDVGPLQDATLSHFAGADPQGVGWGENPWERRPVRLIGRQYDQDARTLVDTYMDTYDYCVALWDPGISHEAPTLDRRGLALLAQGGPRRWSRGGPAWCENAAAARAGTVQLVGLAANQDKATPYGTLLEASRQNYLIQSAFKNGGPGNAFTAWIKSGEGSNGSAINEETSDILFELVQSGRVAKIISGSPIHAADLQIQGTATASIAANSKVPYSVYRKDLVGGVGLYVALQRGVDSRWWRSSDDTWQVAKTWNQLPYSAAWARWTGLVSLGASASALTAVIGVPTTGVAGQTHLVGHVQIEVGEYATSPVLTEAAAVIRAADALYYDNDHGKRVWPAEFLTGRIGFRPLWSSSQLPSGAVRVMLDSYYDASNYDRLFYDQASAALVGRRRRGGTNHDATKAVSLTAGQLYQLGFRVAGSRGEWGLAPYTVSVFVDGAKGTDAVATGVHVLPSKHSFRVGHRDNAGTPADVMDGHFQDLEVRNRVLRDGEMLA